MVGLNAFPDGAPPTCCVSMTPDHGVDPQTTYSPFVTVPAKVNSKIRINFKFQINFKIK